MKHFENKIPPPGLMVLVALLMFAASCFLPQRGPNTLLQWFGIAWCLGIAGYFGTQAIRLFRHMDTTIDPIRIDKATILVTSGIYQVTRNPMYVGLALILSAWGIWLWSPYQAIGPAFFVAFIHRFQILPEERVMAERFGEEYLQYKATVRRWL